MKMNQLPKMNMQAKETGCCPRFDAEAWEGQTIEFEDKLFARADTVSFMHIPLNMGSAIKKAFGKIMAVDGSPKDYYLIMSRDVSPWKGEHYFAVTKEIPGLPNVKMTGKFLAKVFEGPYSNAGKWVKEMGEYVAEKGHDVKDLYFFYTTCPGCAKKLGKNYTVALAKID